MGRILVVANQTLGCDALDEALDAYASHGLHDLHFVAPITAVEGEHQWDYPAVDRYIPDPRRIAHELAAARLEHEIQRLRARGVRVTGEVVDEDPVARVRDILAVSTYDEIIVCTLPERFSRWLRMDLPQRLKRVSDVPVRHVPGSAGPSL